MTRKGIVEYVKDEQAKASTLSNNDIANVFKDMNTKYMKSQAKFVMLTGYQGMIEFDFQMIILASGVKGDIRFKFFRDTSPRSRNWGYMESKRKKDFIYLNLLEKHGMYKLKFYHKSDLQFKLHMYKGTELLFVSDSFNDISNYLNKLK